MRRALKISQTFYYGMHNGVLEWRSCWVMCVQNRTPYSTSIKHKATNKSKQMNFTNLSNLRQTQVEKQPGKQVTWSENLLDIRTISPRYSKDQFRFLSTPNKTDDENCHHFICGVGQPCRLRSRSSSSSLHKATKSQTIVPPSQYEASTRPTTIHLNSSPQLQEVIYRAVASDHLRSGPKHEKDGSKLETTFHSTSLKVKNIQKSEKFNSIF